MTFESTAYIALCDTGCTGVTYSGYDVRNTIYSPKGRRILASDNSVLPIGTVVEVKVGKDWRFEAVVLDRGSAIVGKRLDLLVKTEERAFEFGRRSVKVRIIN